MTWYKLCEIDVRMEGYIQCQMPFTKSNLMHVDVTKKGMGTSLLFLQTPGSGLVNEDYPLRK